jgi:hypothetical protein
MLVEAYNGSTPKNIQTDNEGILLFKQASSKYEHDVLNETVFIGANLGGTPVTTQAGLSATTPALTLYNPVGSGVNLVLLTVTVDITTAPAAAAGLMLAYNLLNATAPATTTDATMISAIIGSTTAPKGRCYRIATLAAAPLAFRFIGGTTGAAAIGGVQLIDNVDGAVIIPPGVAISIQGTSAAAILASYVWKEVVN